MKTISGSKLFSILLLFVIISVSGYVVIAQKGEIKVKNSGFCSGDNNGSWGDKKSFNELREMTIPAGALTVDGGRNGGVRIKGENRPDILVRACVQTWGKSEEEAKGLASGVRIETSPSIRATGAEGDQTWGVSYEISVPVNTDLNLTAHNGGISIGSVEGNIQFQTTNGGVSLQNLAGSVKGKTSNGGVNVALAGSAWRGSGLDVQTTNGGVNINMASNYAARIVTGTVNGGLKSDIDGLVTVDNEKKPWGQRVTKINTDINGGGPTISVVTVNGGVRITSDKE